MTEVDEPSRAYRSPVREEQAERTKQRIAQAARRRFIESGWSGTSVRSVAAEAGVSEATVYAVYGTKAGLASSLIHSGETDADIEQARAELAASDGDPASQLAAFVRFDRRLFERAGDGLRLTVEGRRNEPALASAYELGRSNGNDARRRVLSTWPRAAFREGMTLERALDIYSMICSIQTFDIAVDERGWSPEEVERWWIDTLTTLLLA